MRSCTRAASSGVRSDRPAPACPDQPLVEGVVAIQPRLHAELVLQSLQRCRRPPSRRLGAGMHAANRVRQRLRILGGDQRGLVVRHHVGHAPHGGRDHRDAGGHRLEQHDGRSLPARAKHEHVEGAHQLVGAFPGSVPPQPVLEAGRAGVFLDAAPVLAVAHDGQCHRHVREAPQRVYRHLERLLGSDASHPARHERAFRDAERTAGLGARQEGRGLAPGVRNGGEDARRDALLPQVVGHDLRHGHDGVEAAERRQLEAFAQPALPVSAVKEAVHGGDGGNAQAPGYAPVHDVGPVTVHVHDIRTQSPAKIPERLPLAEVRAGRNFRDVQLHLRAEEPVVEQGVGLPRRDDGEDVRIVAARALARRERVHHPLEPTEARRGHHLQDAQHRVSAPLPARAGRTRRAPRRTPVSPVRPPPGRRASGAPSRTRPPPSAAASRDPPQDPASPWPWRRCRRADQQPVHAVGNHLLRPAHVRRDDGPARHHPFGNHHAERFRLDGGVHHHVHAPVPAFHVLLIAGEHEALAVGGRLDQVPDLREVLPRAIGLVADDDAPDGQATLHGLQHGLDELQLALPAYDASEDSEDHGVRRYPPVVASAVSPLSCGVERGGLHRIVDGHDTLARNDVGREGSRHRVGHGYDTTSDGASLDERRCSRIQKPRTWATTGTCAIRAATIASGGWK